MVRNINTYIVTRGMATINEIKKEDMFELKQKWWKEFNEDTGYHFSQSKHYFEISSDNNKIGYIELEITDNVTNLCNIIIDKIYRNKGCGHRAMEFIEKFARDKKSHKIRVKTSKEINPAGYNLYLKHGFREEAVLKNDYFNKDWVILCKYIEDN